MSAPRRSPISSAAVGTPTVPAPELRSMLQAFAELGYDRQRLLAAAGLDLVDLDDPDLRLPCTVYGALLTQAQRERVRPNIALRLAMHTPIGAFPLLDYLIVTSDTVRAGLHQLRRYFQLTGSPVVIEIRDDSELVRFMIVGSPDSFSTEFLCALVILNLRQETDGKFAASMISFSHQPDDDAAMASALGCPVESRASWNGLVISRQTWDLLLRRRDPVLRGVLENQADALVARLPSGTGIVRDLQRVLLSLRPGTDLAIVRRPDSWGRPPEPCNAVWPQPEPRIRKSSIDGEKKPRAIT